MYHGHAMWKKYYFKISVFFKETNLPVYSKFPYKEKTDFLKRVEREYFEFCKHVKPGYVQIVFCNEQYAF